MTWLDRVLAVVMRVLPAEFRAEYEREMTSAFRSARHDTEGAGSTLRLWLATLVDVIRTAPSLHLDILRRDVGYAVRMLVRRPALTLTATLTLALGIGANTAIFSVVRGVLFAPLAYRDAERLVFVQERDPQTGAGPTGYYSFDALRSRQQTFDEVAAMSGWSAIVTGDGQDAERVNGVRVSWNFFRTLGIVPAVGRDFDASEDHPDRRRVVLISDALWRRRFAANPTVVGGPITLNQVTYTLAGVMPASLDTIVTSRTFPDTEVWTPLGYLTTLPQACRTCRHIQMVGRLRADVAAEQAEADLSRVYQALGAEFPSDFATPRAVVTPLRDYFLGPVRSTLLLLWAAVGLLLVMACANIANLLLIRASERDEEVAIRRALGVSPVRMLRQLLTESAVLALMGGVAGGALAWWATALLVANAPSTIPRLASVTVDARVLLYAMAISLATGVLFGLAPARLLLGRTREIGGSSSPLLAGRRVTAGRGEWRYRAGLIAANVSIAAILLTGSGLLIRSFARLIVVDPGFDPQGLVTLQATVSGPRYGTVGDVDRFYEDFLPRLAQLPGVASVSASTQVPLTGTIDRSSITIEGREPANPAEAPDADRYAVRPDYFATMRVPVIAGRAFDKGDRAGAPPVAIVGRTMAATLWPGESPIGHRIRIAGGPNNPMRTIVGVVGDVRHDGLHVPAALQVYMPHAQAIYPEPMMVVVVRMAGDRAPSWVAGAARAVLRELDPFQPLTQMQTYEAIVAQSMATRRFTLTLLAVFGSTSFALALIGLYGALSYVVSQRSKEIGVRLALGAAARDILRLVVRQGMAPVGVGLAGGVLVSLAAAQTIESLLYDVPARDVVTLAAVIGSMATGGLMACFLPARRAARIHPALTLRAE